MPEISRFLGIVITMGRAEVRAVLVEGCEARGE